MSSLRETRLRVCLESSLKRDVQPIQLLLEAIRQYSTVTIPLLVVALMVIQLIHHCDHSVGTQTMNTLEKTVIAMFKVQPQTRYFNTVSQLALLHVPIMSQ